MDKTISIYKSSYSLDMDTQQGKDLFAAYQLVSMFGMPPIPESQLPIEAIVKLANVRREYDHYYNSSYLAAASLCSEHDAKVAHHIAFVAYSNLPSKYRPLAIIEMSKVQEYKDVSAFSVYQLGLKLAEEHRFAEAIAHINIAISKEPHDPLYHVWLANTMVKMKNIDEALKVLYDYRETEYYQAGYVQTFIGRQTMQQLDYNIKDIEAKKARGYVYRPRKRSFPKQLSSQEEK